MPVPRRTPVRGPWIGMLVASVVRDEYCFPSGKLSKLQSKLSGYWKPAHRAAGPVTTTHHGEAITSTSKLSGKVLRTNKQTKKRTLVVLQRRVRTRVGATL